MAQEYISLRELSRRLGVSARTVRSWVHDPADPLPAYQPHGKLLFAWPEVQRWLERHRVQPQNIELVLAEILSQHKTDAEQGRSPEDGDGNQVKEER